MFLWDRVKFWASLWVSISLEFKDSSFFFISIDWEGAMM